jgi:2,3,4,5-tetrahydropyridine-2-carboxylate N-succinyltransferase
VCILATRPRQFGSREYGLPCVLIVKHVAAGERHEKGQLEQILRDHGATL